MGRTVGGPLVEVLMGGAVGWVGRRVLVIGGDSMARRARSACRFSVACCWRESLGCGGDEDEMEALLNVVVAAMPSFSVTSISSCMQVSISSSFWH